ncbi:MAG: NADH-quinone oxidoreductase subunit NuoK [Acidobacteriota bacterium]|nr:NADH-quinone oxidoreductase subunit NuoK [Acidobacteriota bacterium]MDQ7087629.1 NADH-quinone oxidoreductase subunit NuoK [Acidobacteriota bacterium]
MADAPSAALLLSSLLFAIGAFGVLTRRGAITILMCIEIMLNSANLALVSVSRALPGVGGSGAVDGQVMALFVLAIAAAEAAVGLAIVIALFRLKGSTDIDLARLLKW